MTIKEIAQLAGVSTSTVSRIVNNKDQNINPQTRSRVLKIVKEYNYTPYGDVKNISGTKKFVIGVLLRSISEVSSLMLEGILETAQEFGYTIMLLNSQNSLETEAKHITAFCKNNVDGVLWEPVSDESCRYLDQLTRQDIPFCFMNGCSEYPSYEMDFQSIAYELTQKLVDHKHTSIACLLPEGMRYGDSFLKGFQKCLYDHQIPYTGRMLISDASEDQITSLSRNNITGIVSADYQSALSLYEQIRRINFRIPSDFSLAAPKLTADFSSLMPISGILLPYREFGSYICGQLISRCEKISEEEPVYLYQTDWNFDHEASLDSPSFLRSKRFVVVGSINMDITFNVDQLPQAGKATNILNSAVVAGGKGANESVGIARFGHEVSLIGEIGNDGDATYLFDMLIRSGVHTEGIHRSKKNETGKAYIYIESGGESTISILPGANNALTAPILEERQHLFKDAGSCLISTEIPVEAAIKAAELAKKYGARTFLKPSILRELPESLVQHTDLFIPNRKEASLLCPINGTIEEQAEYFLSLGIPVVIITLGHDGCYLKTAEEARHFPAPSFTAIDTTGGADAFISSLASYLYDGYTLDKSIQIAMYAAGFCISRQGVIPALADKYTLETYIMKKAPELLL